MANKKQRDTAAADAELKAKRAGAGVRDDDAADKSGPTDILAGEDDDDVIF